MTRKRIYLAGPISKGDRARNVNQATAAFLDLARAGLTPWCPHWSVYAVPDGAVNTEAGAVICGGSAQPNDLSLDDWLAVDLPWVSVADAVLRLPGESVGADREVCLAVRLGIPVFLEVEEVIVWARGRGIEKTNP